MKACFSDVLLREYVPLLNVDNCMGGGGGGEMVLIGNVVILQSQKNVELLDSWKRSVAISP